MPGPGGQQKGCPRKAEMTDGLSAQGALECSFILSRCALPAPSPPFPPYHISHSSCLQIYSSSWLWLACPTTSLHPAFLSSPRAWSAPDTREALHHRDGKCQLCKTDATFMAPLPPSAKFRSPWKLGTLCCGAIWLAQSRTDFIQYSLLASLVPDLYREGGGMALAMESAV